MGHHQRSRSLELDMSGLTDAEGGGNELSDYLIQRDKTAGNNNNPISSFMSGLGETFKKAVPLRRTGTTGSIEDDIAVRFGMFSGLTGSGTGSTAAENSSCLDRCGFTLSRKERIIGFFILLGMGLLFFTLSGFYIPVLIFKARKFSIFFTLGSVFTFAGLSLLWGFVPFIKHLFSAERLPFTALYVGSLAATLYFSIGLQSTILTIVGISIQIISLLSFFISYLPGGVTGMKYLTKFVSSSFTRTLPI